MAPPVLVEWRLSSPDVNRFFHSSLKVFSIFVSVRNTREKETGLRGTFYRYLRVSFAKLKKYKNIVLVTLLTGPYAHLQCISKRMQFVHLNVSHKMVENTKPYFHSQEWLLSGTTEFLIVRKLNRNSRLGKQGLPCNGWLWWGWGFFIVIWYFLFFYNGNMSHYQFRASLRIQASVFYFTLKQICLLRLFSFSTILVFWDSYGINLD